MPTGLNIATWNIQSLIPSLDQVRLILNTPHEASVLGFIETWLNDTVSDNDINIHEYKLIACSDRDYNTWGGVAMCIEEDIPCEERKDLRHHAIEAVWIEITAPKAPPLLIGTVYRPESPVQWYDNLLQFYYCDKAFIEGKEMIIIGDINLDYLKPTKLPNRWTSIMESYDMTQIIKEQIKVTERTKSCIDHI